MASQLFASLFRKAPQVPASTPYFPYKLAENPYRCKRIWPPDFEKLSQKHQFHLERRYKRRSKLKYARPNWMKLTKLVQWGSILFVLVYGVVWLDFDGRGGTLLDRIQNGGWDQVETVEQHRKRLQAENGAASGQTG